MGRLDDFSREKGPLSHFIAIFSIVCLSSLHVLGFMGRLDDLSGGAYLHRYLILLGTLPKTKLVVSCNE